MAIVRKGDVGPEVDLIQSVLKRLGFYKGEIDGIFGSETEAAVKEFQKAYGINPDGIVGPITYDKLFPYLNGYTLYRVEPGESFYTIAQKFNTNVAFLITANPSVDPNNIPIGKVIVVPFGTVVPTDVRYTSAVIEANIIALNIIYPFLEVGNIATSVLQAHIPYLKIGRGAKKVLYVGSIHGSEWITSMMLMKFIEDYCKSIVTRTPIYGYTPFEIYDNVSIYIVPMANPDGVDIATGAIKPSNEIYQGILDTAKRHPEIPFPTGWKANIRGVDLDLQFPAEWEEAKRINYAKGFSSPAPSNFPGYGPLTEPESVGLYDFCRSQSFSQLLSYHTLGEVIDYKFKNAAPEGADYLAQVFSEASGYRLIDTPEDYAYASLKDWFIQDFNRPGFVIKPGMGTNPSPLNQFGTIYGQNLPILIYGALL